MGERHRRDAAVMFIDLDRFKLINDSLGHAHGDQLLVAVAGKLKACMREGDTVARWGGDEFVILLVDLDSREDIAVVAQRVLASLGESIILDGQEIYCTASIGASVFPDDGNTAEVLLKHADLAMYRSKSQGRNAWRFYTQDMQQGVDRRFSLENQLRRAIDKNEFSLNFQPQIELASGHVIGAEALIRWQHPELGLVPPSLFIPVAEDSGMMDTIGEWVLHMACAEEKRWQTMGLTGICVAVNISPCQFAQHDLAERIVSALDANGLQACDIELEITEGLVMRNPVKTVDTLRQLNALGIRAALDDFGTGHSSLAYFKNFPVSRLKIDKSFVQDETIVRAVIQMAISYGIQIVAEGVEDEATAQMLYRLGCDVVQGYYYSKPLSADQFVAFAQDRMKML
jgi:diguanylate cyclase (GGDEF)-like protein